jgi:hypothetical protein
LVPLALLVDLVLADLAEIVILSMLIQFVVKAEVHRRQIPLVVTADLM